MPKNNNQNSSSPSYPSSTDLETGRYATVFCNKSHQALQCQYSTSRYNISNFTPPSDSEEQLFSYLQTSSTLPTLHGSFSFIDTIYKTCLFIKHCSYLLTCLASIFMPSFNIFICTACLWTETRGKKKHVTKYNIR